MSEPKKITHYNVYHKEMDIYQIINMINKIQKYGLTIVRTDEKYVRVRGDLKQLLLFLSGR